MKKAKTGRVHYTYQCNFETVHFDKPEGWKCGCEQWCSTREVPQEVVKAIRQRAYAEAKRRYSRERRVERCTTCGCSGMAHHPSVAEGAVEPNVGCFHCEDCKEFKPPSMDGT